MSEAQGFAHPEFLAETEWLAAHLDDPNLVVLDCTTHLIPDPKITYTVKPGREDFEKGHIPGAQFLDLQADLSAKHPKLRFMLPNAEEFAAAMGRFGVGENPLQHHDSAMGGAGVVDAAQLRIWLNPHTDTYRSIQLGESVWAGDRALQVLQMRKRIAEIGPDPGAMPIVHRIARRDGAPSRQTWRRAHCADRGSRGRR